MLGIFNSITQNEMDDIDNTRHTVTAPATNNNRLTNGWLASFACSHHYIHVKMANILCVGLITLLTHVNNGFKYTNEILCNHRKLSNCQAWACVSLCRSFSPSFTLCWSHFSFSFCACVDVCPMLSKFSKHTYPSACLVLLILTIWYDKLNAS